jgi:hypothetical protein
MLGAFRVLATPALVYNAAIAVNSTVLLGLHWLIAKPAAKPQRSMFPKSFRDIDLGMVEPDPDFLYQGCPRV